MGKLVFNTDFDEAQGADGGAYITTSGIVVGEIEKFLFDDNGKSCTISFLGNDGRIAPYIRLSYKQNDGKPHFEKRKLDSLFALCDVPSVSYEERVVDGKAEYYSPELANKRIALSLQRNEYISNNDEVKFNMRVKHFLDPETYQTYREKKEGAEAKSSQVKYEDIEAKKPASGGGGGGGFANAPIDDDLPF